MNCVRHNRAGIRKPKKVAKNCGVFNGEKMPEELNLKQVSYEAGHAPNILALNHISLLFACKNDHHQIQKKGRKKAVGVSNEKSLRPL